MNTILRSLIVWFVLLAVPFQGFAVAAMVGCGAASQAVSMSGGHAAGVDAHTRAVQMAMSPSAHDHAAMNAVVPDPHTAQHDANSHHGSGKCSTCSACSIGAAMAPASLPALAVHAPPALSIPPGADHVSSVDLALPERPPRTTLA